MLIATAGHVDHGKTSLVRALTGSDTDRLPEEKRRGLTIEPGFANCSFEGGNLSFVDVPGHERFVRNMLAGLSGIEFALLVVAADDGPMPQTVEHLAILDLLGVRRGAVALTKIDAVEPDRVYDAQREVEALLERTSLEGSEIFPVSSVTGEGIPQLVDTLVSASGTHNVRPGGRYFRMSVDRRFTRPGAGLVVTGTALAGVLRVGDSVTLLPGRTPARVRAAEVHGESREAVSPGERCALNLAGRAGVADVERGHWLTTAPSPPLTTLVDTHLLVLSSEPRALAEGTPVHVHVGAGDVSGRVYPLEEKAISPGESGFVRIALDAETHTVFGDPFIIRDQSARRTIGGGRIVDALPPRRGARKPARIQALEALRDDDARAALGGLLALEGGVVALDEFVASRNVDQAQASALVTGGEDYPAPETIELRGARHCVSRAVWRSLVERLEHRLEAFHSDHPDQSGPRQAELARSAPGDPPSAVLSLALNALIASGAARRAGAAVRLASHTPRLPPADEALWRKVQQVVGPAEMKPPVVVELAERFGMKREEMAAFLKRCAARGLLIQVAANRYYHPAAVAALARAAEALAQEAQDGLFDAASFRDRTSVGRNLSIQILEHFDQTKLTRRLGDVRQIVGRSDLIFGAAQSADAQATQPAK